MMGRLWRPMCEVMKRLGHALPRWLNQRDQSLAHLATRLSPQHVLRITERAEAKISQLGAMLESLNVLAVLKRGYTLVKDSQGNLLKDATALQDGMALTLQFHDGTRDAVAGTKPKKKQKDLFE